MLNVSIIYILDCFQSDAQDFPFHLKSVILGLPNFFFNLTFLLLQMEKFLHGENFVFLI